MMHLTNWFEIFECVINEYLHAKNVHKQLFALVWKQTGWKWKYPNIKRNEIIISSYQMSDNWWLQGTMFKMNVRNKQSCGRDGESARMCTFWTKRVFNGSHVKSARLSHFLWRSQTSAKMKIRHVNAFRTVIFSIGNFQLLNHFPENISSVHIILHWLSGRLDPTTNSRINDIERKRERKRESTATRFSILIFELTKYTTKWNASAARKSYRFHTMHDFHAAIAK